MFDKDTREGAHKHDSHEPGRATVAVFQSRAEAREAIAALHKAHYTHTWLGVTSIAEAAGGEETVTVESQQGGFFSKTQSLVDALVSHGVHGDAARRLEDEVEPGSALVTLDPKDKDLSEALVMLEQHGGRVAGRTAPLSAPPRGSVAPASAAYAASATDDWEEEMFYRRPSTLR